MIVCMYFNQGGVQIKQSRDSKTGTQVLQLYTLAGLKRQLFCGSKPEDVFTHLLDSRGSCLALSLRMSLHTCWTQEAAVLGALCLRLCEPFGQWGCDAW